jgi:hypothetical protein
MTPMRANIVGPPSVVELRSRRLFGQLSRQEVAHFQNRPLGSIRVVFEPMPEELPSIACCSESTIFFLLAAHESTSNRPAI